MGMSLSFITDTAPQIDISEQPVEEVTMLSAVNIGRRWGRKGYQAYNPLPREPVTQTLTRTQPSQMYFKASLGGEVAGGDWSTPFLLLCALLAWFLCTELPNTSAPKLRT